jgi:hypothetical protein
LNHQNGFELLTGKMGKYIQPRTKGSGHGSTSRAFYARTSFLKKLLSVEVNGKQIIPNIRSN